MEACGTSGMKASVNGTLHCSTLDGWWPEGFNGRNGWAIGGESSDDAADAAALYDTIEQKIVPLYYTLDERNLPAGWIAMMKEAIKSVAPRFGGRRMMKEYLEKFYLPISRIDMNTQSPTKGV
jgi:starch phosphorylase